MLHRTRNLFLISAIAISLAACSDSSQTATNSTATPNSSSAVSPVSDSSKKANTAAGSATVPGIKNASDIQFKPLPKNTFYGVFDTVNDNATAPLHKVAKAAPVKVAGWAILPNKKKIADAVIITLADDKTVVTVAPVNIPRPDVAKFLKNPVYQNSGWTTTINPATLPAGKSVLKAWAYDSATKEATLLGKSHEIEIAQ